MNQFMIEIDLPTTFSEEYMELIPKQREKVIQLMSKKILVNFTLSANRDKIWTIVNAETEIEVMGILGTFPLYAYMVFNIHKIALHENVQLFLPQISLN
ncbi:MAG: hypothetical protein EAZ97_05750 [Bacteroidetes bacterium]|nr:MAG: hypothetical protein EAZ97_05750 [Bacteroidota bacterium]